MKTRKTFLIVAMLAIGALLLGAFGAMAQDDDAMMQADAMIRAFTIEEMPEGWTLPESIGHVTNGNYIPKCHSRGLAALDCNLARS